MSRVLELVEVGEELAKPDARQRCVTQIRLVAPDRWAFERAIDRHLEAYGRAHTAVGLVDINCFTEINSQYGQEYAEALLQEMVLRMRKAFDGSCVVGRVGTDTFGIVGSDEMICHTRLEDLRARPFCIDGQEHVVSMSISVALASECDTATGSAVLLAATLAMKTARAKGYGGHAYYSRALGKEAKQRSKLREMLQAAIGTEQLFLAFQPQIELSTNRVTGTEALLRWRTPSGEFISPEVFVPVAEQSGMMVNLGYQVMIWALQAGKRLRATGLPGLRMAVNVSIPQFRDAGFISAVQRALVITKSLPSQLELEITESVAGLGETHLINVLTELRKMGVIITIDDFGTGYSSLAYADRLPADRLKVDRSFISSLQAGRAESCIVKTIIRLGHDLGWKVLAEGVETNEQAEILRRLECDEVQGYYFARPMVEADLLRWLKGTAPVQI